MNSIILVKDLFEKKSKAELSDYLKGVWNKVWSTNGKLSYANLRLFKTVDKIKIISDLGVIFKSKMVLDVGCGNGITLLYLRKYFDITGVGVDISDSIINDLTKNITDTKLSFFKGDHRDLNMLRSDQFDIVLSFGVIEHFQEYCLALSEVRRVLKPSGKIILVQPHLFSFGVIQEYCLRIIGRWRFGKQKDLSFLRYKNILRQTGFKNITYVTRPPYSDMRVTRVLDSVMKKFLPFWGHYLYLIASK